MDDTPQPFVVGRNYRVKKTVEDYFSSVREGQILRYLERGFAVYDETWCFNFLDPEGKRLYWCLHDGEPIEQWREVFEDLEKKADPDGQRTTRGI